MKEKSKGKERGRNKAQRPTGNEPLTFDSWDHQAVKLIIGIQFVSLSRPYKISGEERDGHQVGREAAERVRRQLRVPHRQTVGQFRL